MNLQNWGSGVWHFAHQKALVDRDARLQWTIGALGSRLAKVNQHVALVGAGADGPGQRRDVHRRQAAPFVPHAAAPPGRRTAAATCSIRARCRTIARWSGAA